MAGQSPKISCSTLN